MNYDVLIEASLGRDDLVKSGAVRVKGGEAMSAPVRWHGWYICWYEILFVCRVIFRELHGMTGQGEFRPVNSFRRPMSNNTLNAALRWLGDVKER
jgi:hypothetical protein